MSEDFGSSKSDVLRSHVGGLVGSGGHKGSSCEVICLTEESTGALMYGSDCGFVKDGVVDTGQSEMVCKVVFHGLPVYGFKMCLCYDSRSQGSGCGIVEFVCQVVRPMNTMGASPESRGRTE